MHTVQGCANGYDTYDFAVLLYIGMGKLSWKILHYFVTLIAVCDG